ncbi:Flagellar basal-body rod protein FlgG [hydrothermal vent metagenome]|uniref:Flagellar basal-body rod protein FlgG n=1 Tax=hydrothermal vent metagenome TaxID=652676 RepID=A0A3B1BQM7_9ZZZZ
MNRSLFTAASGMSAQQLNVDVIANNLANVNTIGFKKSRADFQDLLYETLRAPGTLNSTGSQVPTGIQVGLGVKPAGVTKMFLQGDMRNTQNEFDVAIDGKGFYQIQMPDASIGYTRAGNFQVDSDGQIVNLDGYPMLPSIAIPQDATLVSIDTEGRVNVMQPGSTAFSEVGQIELANFVNPAGLLSDGKSIYKESEASGPPITGLPATNEFGSILQGFVEVSNVSVVEELTQMIIAQRGYEVNSKAVQASDEMLQQASALKR